MYLAVATFIYAILNNLNIIRRFQSELERFFNGFGEKRSTSTFGQDYLHTTLAQQSKVHLGLQDEPCQLVAPRSQDQLLLHLSIGMWGARPAVVAPRRLPPVVSS